MAQTDSIQSVNNVGSNTVVKTIVYSSTDNSETPVTYTFPTQYVAKYGLAEMLEGINAGGSFNGGSITGTTIFSNASVTIDATNTTSTGAPSLTLKSSFAGGDDVGYDSTHWDSTSRIYLSSYQRAGTNNLGEVIRISGMKWSSKQMTAYYFPDAYDGSGNPIGNLNAKVWFGAHAQATGGDSNHNHLEVEVNDSKGYKRGRQTWDFAATTTVDGAASSNDPASVGIGLDTTYINFNQAHVIISNSSTRQYQGGDTTIPTGVKVPSFLRMNGSEGTNQAIQFARDYYGSIRRWEIRNSSDPESQIITITGSPTGGTFTLTVRGQTTSALAYNAAASDVKTALEALALVTTGSVTSTGSAGGPYTVSFAANTLASGATISGNATNLTGGTSPTITSAGGQTGAAFQIGAYNDSGTLLGRAINIDRSTGLITIGADSAYQLGGLLLNKSNTGNALKIVNTFAGGTSFYANTQNTASRALQADVIGDSSQRYVLYSDGKIEWGSGSAARDTNIYRKSAGVLSSDYKITALLGIGVGNSATASTVGTLSRKMEVFDATGASLGFVPIYTTIT